MASLSKLDAVYRSIVLSKFFTKGWGKPENLKRLFEFRKVISDREQCQKLVPHDYPICISKKEEHSYCHLLEGHFISPFVQYIPGVLPKEAELAHFQMVLPKQWPAEPLHPVCIHLAGTGDHFFWRRRALMAKPLLKEAAIASILLENPYYGFRKPKNQVRSSLHNVSDILVMGGCLILESLALLHWCETQGYGPLGITGISMGGHMASLAACNWHKPLAVSPCLSWTTASCVFTQGVMSYSIPWSLLERQYVTDTLYKDELLKMISIVEGDAFQAGWHFSQTYPDSMDCVEQLNVSGSKASEKSSGLSGALGILPTSTNLIQSIHSQASEFKNYVNSASTMPWTVARKKTPKDEVVNFMRGIMDECTHLANFTPPVDPTLAVIVAARNDAYVLQHGIKSLPELWPGCQVRYLNCGHIAAYLFNLGTFRSAIIEAFEKTAQKYYHKSLVSGALAKKTLISES